MKKNKDYSNKEQHRIDKLVKLAHDLEQSAENNDIQDTLTKLNNSKKLIKSLGNKQSEIIKYFYLPYSIAYEESNFDFCSKYQIEIDKLTGLESALFYDEDR